MAEKFQGEVCGGNWLWNSSRNLFGSSPFSLATNDVGSLWPMNHDVIMDMDMKAARSSDDSEGGEPQPTKAKGGVSVGSTLQMMGIGLLSADDWNQNLLQDGARSEQNYSNFLLNSSIDYQHEKDDDFPRINSIGDSSMNSYKQVNQSFADLEQQQLDSISTSTDQSAATCSGLTGGFPLNPASYSYASSLLQTLFDTDSDEPETSLLENQAMNYSTSAAKTNYQLHSNGFLPSLPKASPMVNHSLAKQQPINDLPVTNNAPLWNASAAALSNVRSTFLPPTQSQFLPSSNLPSFGDKHQHDEGGKDSASVMKKASNEPAKRPRIETPSPLPTFKVRKEKLGDRVTALQQLVSPFGKTDTASVLHEAIEYIKFLHDQVNALSTPYLKYGSPPQQRAQGVDKPKDQEELIRDLKSRGLCLVPISSTFPVTTETTSDFWTPTSGANLK